MLAAEAQELEMSVWKEQVCVCVCVCWLMHVGAKETFKEKVDKERN